MFYGALLGGYWGSFGCVRRLCKSLLCRTCVDQLFTYIPISSTNVGFTISPSSPPSSLICSRSLAQCNKCPSGHYGSQTAQTSALIGCKKCLAGTANANGGESSITACVKCAAGRFQAEGGQASCDACAAGRYVEESSQYSV